MTAAIAHLDRRVAGQGEDAVRRKRFVIDKKRLTSYIAKHTQ